MSSTPHIATCYRHPDRETGVRCQRCERPVCGACMVPAPVGVQCVECVRQHAPRPLAGQRVRAAAGWARVSSLMLAANVAVWAMGLVVGGPAALLSGSPLTGVAGLFGPRVAAGEWWRLVSAGFLHNGLIHLGLNMAVLLLLGPALEQVLGRLGFAALYLTGLVSSSLGALLLSPNVVTVGASGAVFALMGATLIGQRAAGIDPRASGILPLVVVNLIFTIAVPGISIGGHLGGLASGLLAGAVLFRPRLHPAAAVLGCVAIAAACFVAALQVASHPLVH